MGLYCIKCKKWAYRNHNPKCDIMSLIPITKEMRGVADKLYSLGFGLLSVACFVYPVQNSIYEHKIIIDIEFKKDYPDTLLGDLGIGWKWYHQTITDDHWPLMALAYSETFVWLGFISVEERVKEIVTAFEAYLDTRDKTALGAIMLLIEC